MQATFLKNRQLFNTLILSDKVEEPTDYSGKQTLAINF